jgi:chromate transport protein ChrA
VVRGFLWTLIIAVNDHGQVNYLNGMLYALVSIILGVLFTLMNGKLIQNHDATVISYEFIAGVVLSLFIFIPK